MTGTLKNQTKVNIEIPLDRLLGELGRSYYWLAKETGIGYSTLWRLKSGKALGINFATLIKICEALDCTPCDILTIRREGRNDRTQRVSKTGRKTGPFGPI